LPRTQIDHGAWDFKGVHWMRQQFSRDAPTRSADFRVSIHYDAWAPADRPQVLDPYARFHGTLGAL
jgi:hypothetical protein